MTIIKFFQRISFTSTNADACILTIKWKKELIIVGIYVKDLIFGSKSLKALEWLKDQLMREFSMKDLEEVQTIIRWEITWDLAVDSLRIDQKGYIRDLLEFEGITSCHSTVLSVKVGSILFLDQAGDYQQADLTMYQCLIGKLMYLSCGTRPNIVFVIRELSRHNANPQIGHLRIAKQVLRYLKGTITLNIEWRNNPIGHRLRGKYEELEVVGYADCSYANDLEERKSITRYCFFFGGAIVTWYNKRQRTVSTSTLEAEYMVVSQGTREEIWI